MRVSGIGYRVSSERHCPFFSKPYPQRRSSLQGGRSLFWVPGTSSTTESIPWLFLNVFRDESGRPSGGWRVHGWHSRRPVIGRLVDGGRRQGLPRSASSKVSSKFRQTHGRLCRHYSACVSGCQEEDREISTFFGSNGEVSKVPRGSVCRKPPVRRGGGEGRAIPLSKSETIFAKASICDLRNVEGTRRSSTEIIPHHEEHSLLWRQPECAAGAGGG